MIQKAELYDDDRPLQECIDAKVQECYGDCDACDHRPRDWTSSVYVDVDPGDYWGTRNSQNG